MLVKVQLHFVIHKYVDKGIASVSLDGAIFTDNFCIVGCSRQKSIKIHAAKNEYTFSQKTITDSQEDEAARWLTLECEVDFSKPFTVNVQSFDGTKISFTPVVDEAVKVELAIVADDKSHRRQRSYSEEDLSPASKKMHETSAISSSSSSSSSNALSSSLSLSSSSSFFSTTLPNARQQLLANQVIQDGEGRTVFCAMSWRIPVTAEDMKEFKELVSETAAGVTDFIFNENEIGDDGCQELQHMETIKHLEVAENNISDKGALALSRIPYLQELVIARNEITDEGFLTLVRNSKELTYLDASFNKISDKAIVEILSIQDSHLVYLDLRENADIKSDTLEKISTWLKHNETNLHKIISCAK